MREKINEQLVAELKKGSEEAFEEVYKQCYKGLYNFIYRNCYDIEMTNDVIQNTFIAVFRNKESIRDNKAFYSWVLRIGYRELLRCRSKEQKRLVQTNSYIDIERLSKQEHLDIACELQEQEIIEVIFNRIEEMPEKFRNVALLRYGEECTLKEVATILSIPEGTVKSRLRRVNKTLQKTLEEKELVFDVKKSWPLVTVFMNRFLDMHLQESPPICHALVHHTEAMDKKISVAEQIGQYLKYILGATAICGGITAAIISEVRMPVTSSGTSNPIKQLAVINIPEECKIESITYDTSFTNEAIALDVTTSNDYYDAIMINNQNTLTIYQNGEYTVSLVRDNQVIDSTVLQISNIDIDNPELLGIDNENDYYTIHIRDTQSGINMDSIQYHKNDVLSTEYQYNSETNVLSFYYEKGTKNEFYIEDYAGNWRVVYVNSRG